MVKSKSAATNQEQEKRNYNLRVAMIDGEQSGNPLPFDMGAYIASKLKPSSAKAGFPPSRE